MLVLLPINSVKALYQSLDTLCFITYSHQTSLYSTISRAHWTDTVFVSCFTAWQIECDLQCTAYRQQLSYDNVLLQHIDEIIIITVN